MDDYDYNYEPTGPSFDEAEEWEPVKFERWYYGKKQDDRLMELAFAAEEELRLSIDL